MLALSDPARALIAIGVAPFVYAAVMLIATALIEWNADRRTRKFNRNRRKP